MERGITCQLGPCQILFMKGVKMARKRTSYRKYKVCLELGIPVQQGAMAHLIKTTLLYIPIYEIKMLQKIRVPVHTSCSFDTFCTVNAIAGSQSCCRVGRKAMMRGCNGYCSLTWQFCKRRIKSCGQVNWGEFHRERCSKLQDISQTRQCQNNVLAKDDSQMCWVLAVL